MSVTLLSDHEKFKVGVSYMACGDCGAEDMREGLTWATLPHHPECPSRVEPRKGPARVVAIDEKAGTITIDGGGE